MLTEHHTWRKISIALIIPQKGEGKAHTCEMACSQQLLATLSLQREHQTPWANLEVKISVLGLWELPQPLI
jgi:hypothetical protein